MAKRISQHRVIDYFQLGKFIRQQRNRESPEAEQLINVRAESLNITPNDRNLTLANRIALRMSRNLIHKILDLPVANSHHPLSFEQFVALASIDNQVAIEHMAQQAATLGLDLKQLREHISRTLHEKKNQRPRTGRSRRKFASPTAALMFCRDHLEALNSALRDLKPGLTTDDQRRHFDALEKAFQRASTALKPLAKSCSVELDEPVPRRRTFEDFM